MKTVHLFRFDGRTVKIFDTGRGHFRFEWKVSDGRRGWHSSLTSYSSAEEARYQAMLRVREMNNPQTYLRFHDKTNYWARFDGKQRMERILSLPFNPIATEASRKILSKLCERGFIFVDGKGDLRATEAAKKLLRELGGTDDQFLPEKLLRKN